jgi:hypothetical protein
VSAVAELHDIAVRLEDNDPGLRVVIDFAPAASGHSSLPGRAAQAPLPPVTATI